MKTLLTGATGLLGGEIMRELPETVVLSRNPEKAQQTLHKLALSQPPKIVAWQPESGPPAAEAFAGVQAIVNLAGESVSEGRWNEEKKRRIYDSRILGTRNLIAGIAALKESERPRVLVSASAVGFYGDRGEELLDESSQPGSGFLAEVCVDWEREALAAAKLGVRVVCIRIGIVLSPHGGALGKMLLPFKFGLGGPLASGQQWMPWIHIDDIVGIFMHALKDEKIRGPLNATAPNPVTNCDFTRALAHAVHRPAFLPVPKFALRAAFGEMSDILVASQRVLPKLTENSGYLFHFSQLAQALDAIVAKPNHSHAA